MKYFHYHSDMLSGKKYYFFTCGSDEKISKGCFSVIEDEFEKNLKALERMGYQNRGDIRK